MADARRRWEWPILASYEREEKQKARNANAALDTIEQIGYRSGRLLDVGSFTGLFLSQAKKRKWDVFGLEPLPGAAVYARARYGVSVKTDVLRPGVYPDGFFDAVTAFQVFEHVPSPREGLETVRSLLRTGGLVVIEVPNIDTLWAKVMGSRNRHFVPDHFSFFSALTLCRLVGGLGFTVLRVTYPTRWMSVSHLTAWAERILPIRVSALASQGKLARADLPVNLGDIVCVYARKD